jgi:hypothetical protein
LPAGSYSILLQGLTCDTVHSVACPQIVGLNYFFQPLYIQTGGTVAENSGTFSGHLGWDLFGETVTSPVPEPGTVALVGSGVLGLLAVARRRFRLAA